jgi:hypothetical protein
MTVFVTSHVAARIIRIGARRTELRIPATDIEWDFLIMPFEMARDPLWEVCWPMPRGRRIAAIFPTGRDPDLRMKVVRGAALRPFREVRGVVDFLWAISERTDVTGSRALPCHPLLVRTSRYGGDPELIVHETDVAAWHQLLVDFSRGKILDLLGAFGRGRRALEELEVHG